MILVIRVDPSRSPVRLNQLSYCNGSEGWVDIQSLEDFVEFLRLFDPDMRREMTRALALCEGKPQRSLPDFPPRASEIESAVLEAKAGC